MMRCVQCRMRLCESSSPVRVVLGKILSKRTKVATFVRKWISAVAKSEKKKRERERESTLVTVVGDTDKGRQEQEQKVSKCVDKACAVYNVPGTESKTNKITTDQQTLVLLHQVLLGGWHRRKKHAGEDDEDAQCTPGCHPQ